MPVLSTISPITDYENSYMYDLDGNITRLFREGNNLGSGPAAMDILTYSYGSVADGYSYNQLKTLNDLAPNVYTNDIPHYLASTPNYNYDRIGNVSKDLVSGQDTVKWNLYNKVTYAKNPDSTNLMSFLYDGAGNRVAKYTTSINTTLNDVTCRNDYYVHDAQGNILAIYHETVLSKEGVLTTRNFDLAEHDIYGSSRLGSKDYWNIQVGMSWDYPDNGCDTIRLTQRLPWYSLEYQDVISDTVTSPYGNTDTLIHIVQHTTGQKQYELTDHLGDILVTVSDARTYIQCDTIPYYLPIIKSESDYYPYGMLMPGRYRADSATHCETMSYTEGGVLHHGVIRYWPDGLETPTGSATISSSAPLILMTPHLGDGLKCTLPATPGATVVLQINVGGPPNGLFAAMIDGTSVTTLTAGVNNITYTPTGSTAVLQIQRIGTSPPWPTLEVIAIQSIIWDSITIVPEVVTSQVCSEDQYEYGFNGQMKVNEWAGVGNHTTALYWEYDTRTGRRGNLEPRIQEIPWVSPYATNGNNPIRFKDPNGDIAFWDNLGGAIIGGFVDYVLQVGENRLNGKSWVDALTKVDLASIGISTVAGFATDGVSSLAKSGAKTGAKGVSKVLAKNVAARIAANTAIGTGANIAKQKVKGEDINFGEDLVGGFLGAAIDEKVPSLFKDAITPNSRILGKAANSLYKGTIEKSVEKVIKPKRVREDHKGDIYYPEPKVDNTRVDKFVPANPT